MSSKKVSNTRNHLSWNHSITKRFSKKELYVLRDSSARKLVRSLKRSLNLILVRVLQELIAHGDIKKAKAIYNNPIMQVKIRVLISRLLSEETIALMNILRELS